MALVSGIVAVPAAFAATQDVVPLEEVIVTATFRQQSLTDVPVSATVLSTDVLRDAGQQHFADVLPLVPNLHWAGGSARPRYFQLRGIGEREQYEGAPNPSVGFLIDDIDFSGLGMAATLFDVASIEVLRGPQGTRYGANALAGLIAVRSEDPQSAPAYGAEASIADAGTWSAGFMATGPASSLNSRWRLAVQQYRSDGFVDNAWLDRHTNALDELTGRFKWYMDLGSATRLETTLLHADLDNGYDAWSLDSGTRTFSDRPGEDSQRATGLSTKLLTTIASQYDLTVIASYADSRSLNSFDADWGNTVSWAPYTYDYFSASRRDRDSANVEVRLATPAAVPGRLGWLGGVYVLNMEEDGVDRLQGVYADPSDPTYDGTSDDALASDYDATSLAAFGQLDGAWTTRWLWSAGLRVEQRRAHYQDGGIWDGVSQTTDLRARDRMFGGQLSLSHVLDRTTTYVSLARGYKAGGFNLGGIAEENRYFDPEYLWSVEAGLKARLADGRVTLETAVFHQSRRDLQVRTGTQLDPANPGTYVFVTDNLPRGYNTGVEASVRYLWTPAFEIGGSLGLLRTEAEGGLDENGAPVPKRDQAHAPEYQASIFGAWRHATGLMARIDVAARDNFYFDVATDHNRQSHAYATTNLKFGYEQPAWSVYLWVRNLLDEEYVVRGFYFYNEPPFLEKHLYTQQGEPRQVGMSVRVGF